MSEAAAIFQLVHEVDPPNVEGTVSADVVVFEQVVQSVDDEGGSVNGSVSIGQGDS